MSYTYPFETYYKQNRRKGMSAFSAFRYAKEQVIAQNAPVYAHNIEYNRAGKDGLRWIENIATGLRFVGFADEIATRISHRGWYTDNDFCNSDNVLRGAVYQLPAKDGKERFVAGYADPWNDNAARVEFDIISDKLDAAYRADHIAQQEAESAREYNEAWQAGNQYADTVTEIKDARVHVMELIKAVKKHRGDQFERIICQTLKDNVSSWLRDIAKLKAKRDQLLDDYSAAWRKDVYSAFNEGAGSQIIA